MGDWSLNVGGETGYSIGLRDETVHDVCAGLSLGGRYTRETENIVDYIIEKDEKDEPKRDSTGNIIKTPVYSEHGHTIALTGGFCSQMKAGGAGLRYRFDSILVRTTVFGKVLDGTTKEGRELGYYVEANPKLFVEPDTLGDPKMAFILEVNAGLVVQLLPEARIKIGTGANFNTGDLSWIINAIQIGVDFNL